MYSKMAPIYKDPTLWTEFEINVMKLSCLIDYQECLTAVYNFTRKMLQNDSSNSYVSNEVTNTISMF